MPNLNPKISLDEAMEKYKEYVLSTVENKGSWGKRFDEIYIDFHGSEKLFDEFLPMYLSDNGTPYVDLAMVNFANGIKIIKFLLAHIFYASYIGMEIKYMNHKRINHVGPLLIRAYLRFSDKKEIYQ